MSESIQNISRFFILLVCFSAVAEDKINGTIFLGPEARYFVPCHTDERWWLAEHSSKTEGWLDVSAAIHEQPVCDLANMPCVHANTEVSGVANISKTGEYGHLGKYKKEVTFSSIIVVRKVGVCGFK